MGHKDAKGHPILLKVNFGAFLLRAAERGNIKTVEQLIADGVDVNTADARVGTMFSAKKNCIHTCSQYSVEGNSGISQVAIRKTQERVKMPRSRD